MNRSAGFQHSDLIKVAICIEFRYKGNWKGIDETSLCLFCGFLCFLGDQFYILGPVEVQGISFQWLVHLLWQKELVIVPKLGVSIYKIGLF